MKNKTKLKLRISIMKKRKLTTKKNTIKQGDQRKSPGLSKWNTHGEQECQLLNKTFWIPNCWGVSWFGGGGSLPLNRRLLQNKRFKNYNLEQSYKNENLKVFTISTENNPQCFLKFLLCSRYSAKPCARYFLTSSQQSYKVM